MSKKICLYWNTLLLFALLLSTLDFSNAIDQQKYNSEQFAETNKGKPRGSIRINYIRQSLNTSNGDPFITVELVAPGLHPVECVTGNIGNANGSIAKHFEMCDGWNGSAKNISILHAKLPAEMKAVHIFTIAYNESFKSIMDVSEMDFNTSAFNTNVAIVGSDSMATNASLRVFVGTEEEDVSVGDETCVKGNTCYYPYSEQNITERRKEIDVHGNTENFKIPQYDNSIMPFIKFARDVTVTVSEEGITKVSTTLPEAGLILEVVVYDENEPSNILSKDNKYKCVTSRTWDNTYECSQEIKVTKDLKRVWVLVVAIGDGDGSVVQSTMMNVPITTGVEVWVIVVSVIGGLCVVILIAAAVFFTWKKRNNRNQEKDLTSHENDKPIENNSNLPNESGYDNEVVYENENEEDKQDENKDNHLKDEEVEDQQKHKKENQDEGIKDNLQKNIEESDNEVIKDT